MLSLSAALLVATLLPCPVQAKSYSSGGHSYPSGSHSYGSSSSRSSSSYRSSSSGSSSRSSSSGGSKSFTSSSGRNYSSGSGSSSGGSDRRGYSSSRSYGASSGNKYSSGSSASGSRSSSSGPSSTRTGSSGSDSSFSFDSSAARARKQETSKSDFSRFKESQAPPRIPSSDSARPGNGSYNAAPPPIPGSGRTYYWDTVYVPTTTVIRTRPSRVNIYFGSYGYRPWVYYNDPYSSLFWWWLLDRSLDEQAYWAYHHRYDMDPARYQTLLASNHQLEQRVADLEAQQIARDPSYTPPSLDQTNRDLMYADDYVAHNYDNRPTTAGRAAFWVFAVPLAIGGCVFFIWLIWFKRW